jgi:hypothetical protein
LAITVYWARSHKGWSEGPLDNPDRMLDPRFREGRFLARTFDLVRFFRALDVVHRDGDRGG